MGRAVIICKAVSPLHILFSGHHLIELHVNSSENKVFNLSSLIL